MRILVITFCRGLNPGTFMQAYGVKTGLQKIFPDSDIEFLKFPDYKQKRGGALGKNDSIFAIFKQKVAALYRKRKYRFLEKKHFKLTEQINLFEYDKGTATALLSGYDLIVVGSDTILESVYGSDPTKVGLNWLDPSICSTKHIFFAASASPANFERTDVLAKSLSTCVNHFLYIGVRDSLTYRLFSDFLKIDASRITRQPDPTYFLDTNKFTLPDYYLKRIRSKRVALFNCNAAFEYKREMVRGLKNKGFYVVTTGTCPEVNLCINTIGPFEWAGVFQYVDLVLTERFHDSVFALRNCKPVVAFDWQESRVSQSGDSKTNCILEDYELTENHYVVKSVSDVETILNELESRIAYFNPNRVRELNEKYMAYANTLLCVINDIIIKS